MTKRGFFLRMISLSLLRRRSRMLVALLAIAVGATILSGLVTIYYDVPRQMGAQFRNYGANMIFLASSNEADFTMDTVEQALREIPAERMVGVAPYRYETVLIHEQPIVAAGTDIAGAKATSPYWYIDGGWPEHSGEILIGREEAQFLGLVLGDRVTVSYSSEEDAADHDGVTQAASMDMTVVGLLETGGNEEEYVYIPMEDLDTLTGGPGRLDVVELSISATAEELRGLVDQIHAAVGNIAPRLVKRVTESESTVLTKLQALVLLVTVVVLVLTMISVATTMTAVVTERRKEIGLRKALGASDGEIRREFMGEALLLGLLGGVIGAILGFMFAQFVSVNVFSSSISFQLWLLPVTILSSILVTGLACLLPIRSAIEIDPALVLKGE